jgi:drug/metabolite transporter (DMT)-like permease
MFGLRVLLFVVAYVVVIAEMVAGSAATTPTRGIFWILPGALVIALLLAISNFVLSAGRGDTPEGPTPVHWIIMLATGTLISASAFYFPNYLLGLFRANMMP